MWGFLREGSYVTETRDITDCMLGRTGWGMQLIYCCASVIIFISRCYITGLLFLSIAIPTSRCKVLPFTCGPGCVLVLLASMAYMERRVSLHNCIHCSTISFKVNVSALLVFTTQNLILEQYRREILCWQEWYATEKEMLPKDLLANALTPMCFMTFIELTTL